MDEKEAIRQLKRGDVSALEVLVQLFQVRAVRAAYLIIGDAGLAREVVQESFLRANRSIRGFDEARPFEPWFLRSVVNASIKCVQSTRRELPLEDLHAERHFERLAAQIDSVESQVERSETARDIGLALEKLSPRQRAVIVQRYYLEMSEADMAEEAGTAPGTVKWLLNAARRRLRGLLAERSDR